MEKFSLFPSFTSSKQPKDTVATIVSNNENVPDLKEKAPYIAQNQPLSQKNNVAGEKREKSETMLKILASHAKAVNRIKNLGAPK